MYIFEVSGMTCEGCANSVKSALMALDGVKSVEVDLALNKVSIEAAGVNDAMLIDAIEEAGFDVII